jgi:hypothetical protein
LHGDSIMLVSRNIVGALYIAEFSRPGKYILITRYK